MSSNNENKRVSRGRQKIPLTKIENDIHRQVTFSKRRSGMFKKASELSTLCGVDIAMVVFSPADKVYTFGSPSVDAVLNKYFGENVTPEAGVTDEIIRAHYEDNMRIITPQISDMESLVHDLTKENQAHCESEKGRPLISNLQLHELENMKHNLETLSSQTYETLKEPLMQVQSHDLAPPVDGGSLFGPLSYFRINNDGAGPSGTS